MGENQGKLAKISFCEEVILVGRVENCFEVCQKHTEVKARDG